MDTELLRYIGHRLYQTEYLKEWKRYLVFRARCRMHAALMEEVLDFFAATPLRREMLRGTPAFAEQVTRAFFYKGSDWQDRWDLVRHHVEFMERNFTEEALRALYVEVRDHQNVGQHLVLWQEESEGQPLQLALWFNAGQRKEGCLSLVLELGDEALYQIMFWFGKSLSDPTRDAIWVGALQGTPNGSAAIKRLTKEFFGYRTKNLVFYGLRSLARCLGLDEIYAVTNEGYYAMNHVRRDRKLKTDFGEFWKECEGVPCGSDSRFFRLPVAEYRKVMSELKPSKRAQHRRRFARLDAIDAAFDASCKAWRRE